MPTLHMEVEACRSTHSNMVNQRTQIEQTLTAITQAVNSTVGSAWIGQSATEFQQQYDQLRTAIISQLDQLNTLNSNLANEISQWEQVASRMG